MSRGLTGLALAGTLLLAGCQNLPIELPEGFGGREPEPELEPEPEPTPVRRPPPAAIDLLALYSRSAGLEADAVRRRLEALEPRASAPGCSEARLRSAILRLRLPAGEAGDMERRLAPCEGEHVAPDRAHLARLLGDLAAARRSGEATAAELRERLAETRRQVEALSAENERLQEQLEGLKAIERSIQERDRAREN